LSRDNLIYARADFGISKRFAADEMSQTDGIIARSRKYCSPEVYDGELRGRAADVFSLGCIFLEMATVICGIHLDQFADWRSQTPDGDDSFHGNLEQVGKWIERLSLVSPDGYPRRENLHVLLAITSEMLSYEPDDRPLASAVLMELGGPRECCTREREAYVAEESLENS
jgi:serine/threonine protein kinase